MSVEIKWGFSIKSKQPSVNLFRRYYVDEHHIIPVSLIRRHFHRIPKAEEMQKYMSNWTMIETKEFGLVEICDLTALVGGKGK